MAERFTQAARLEQAGSASDLCAFDQQSVVRHNPARVHRSLFSRVELLRCCVGRGSVRCAAADCKPLCAASQSPFRHRRRPWPRPSRGRPCRAATDAAGQAQPQQESAAARCKCAFVIRAWHREAAEDEHGLRGYSLYRQPAVVARGLGAAKKQVCARPAALADLEALSTVMQALARICMGLRSLTDEMVLIRGAAVPVAAENVTDVLMADGGAMMVTLI